MVACAPACLRSYTWWPENNTAPFGAPKLDLDGSAVPAWVGGWVGAGAPASLAPQCALPCRPAQVAAPRPAPPRLAAVSGACLRVRLRQPHHVAPQADQLLVRVHVLRAVLCAAEECCREGTEQACVHGLSGVASPSSGAHLGSAAAPLTARHHHIASMWQRPRACMAPCAAHRALTIVLAPSSAQPSHCSTTQWAPRNRLTTCGGIHGHQPVASAHIRLLSRCDPPPPPPLLGR